MELTGMMRRNKALFTGKYQEYITPKWLYMTLNVEFNFTLDPCTTPENPLGAPKFYTKEDDGLKKTWFQERVYCNPPYHSKNIVKWIEKAIISGARVVVMLLPARTDTKWFHDYIWKKAEVRFIRGRLCFGGYEKTQERNTAPFPSMIVVFK